MNDVHSFNLVPQLFAIMQPPLSCHLSLGDRINIFWHVVLMWFTSSFLSALLPAWQIGAAAIVFLFDLEPQWEERKRPQQLLF